MNELYELCKSINTFFTYENAQKMADDAGQQDQSDTEGRQAPYKMSGMGGQATEREKKSKKKFKDVPKEDLLRLADNMKVHLIGQDESVDNLADAIQRASIGLKDPNKPIGSFLFAGRTGVGKTLATKILADDLIKGRDNLVNVDCSEYSADHEYSKLIGAPAVYIGHENGGLLTNAVGKNPFCVIVFDEVEKASSKVHELMLQILEEGRLTDGRVQTVSFKDTIIIMTSNVGAKEIEGISKTIGFGDVSEITEGETNKLAKLTKALVERPAINQEIDSSVDPDGDRHALARFEVRDQLKTARLAELAATGQTPSEVKTFEIDSANYERLLRGKLVKVYGTNWTDTLADLQATAQTNFGMASISGNTNRPSSSVGETQKQAPARPPGGGVMESFRKEKQPHRRS